MLQSQMTISEADHVLMYGVLLLPDDCDHDYEPYKKMVHAGNTTQVDPEEILSFNLYRYDRHKAEIEETAV